jgi:hypothetical protein
MSVIDTADTASRIKTARRGPMRSVNRPESGAESAPRPVLTEPMRPTWVRLMPRSSMIGDASTAIAKMEKVDATDGGDQDDAEGPRRIDIPGPYPRR